MPTEKADVFTLAYYGDLKAFQKKFVKEEVNNKNELGSGLLHLSIMGLQYEISLFLINSGIDVNMTNNDGQTALHLISVHPNIDVGRGILNNGGDINLRDKYGNSPLWTAVFNCKGRYYDIVELLLQYNPDIVTKNKAGRSPLDFAKQVGNEKLISWLNR